MPHIHRKFKWQLLILILIFLIISLVICYSIFSPTLKIKSIEIVIFSKNSQHFSLKSDYKNILKKYNIVIGNNINKSILKFIEKEILNKPFVYKVKAYFNNNNQFILKVFEYEALGRIILQNGDSYYLTENYHLLPLNPKTSLQIPIFNNLPYFSANLLVHDTATLNNFYKILTIIKHDDFWLNLLSNINYNKKNFTFYLNFSETIIKLGSLDNMKDKLLIAKKFITQLWLNQNYTYYQQIDLRFNNQVIATKSSKK